MMYFFTPGSSILFALVGLGLIVWLAGAFAKSAACRLSNTPPELEKIDIINTKSKSGRSYIKNYGFYRPLKKYVAEVVCPDKERETMAVADTKERLEELIMKEFERLEL